MKGKLQLIGVLLLVVGVAIGFRNLFPVTVELPPPPPRIITVYDTVPEIDTMWVDRVVERVVKDTVNLTEYVTITVPEIIEVCPTISGVTALDVGPIVGDSTMIAGFDLKNTDNVLTMERWTRRYWTPGPLQALAFTPEGVDVSFGVYVPPVKPCGFWCKTGHYLTGASVGFGACLIAK